MLVSELDYELPEAAIAQRPPDSRDGARLLTVHPEHCEFGRVTDFAELVPPGSLVVLNDTRVRRARVLASKATGGRVEVLFLRPEEVADGAQLWAALVSSNRPVKQGTVLRAGPATIVVEKRTGPGPCLVSLCVEGDPEDFFAAHGHVPLPPYIRREDELGDQERYQTVFSVTPGSAAAPTAGLHLTDKMIARLRQRGVQVGFVTLHVGAGTFLPVRCDDLKDHPMHSERFHIGHPLAQQVQETRRRGGAVVAVGTTVVRALESAACSNEPGTVLACQRETQLMIQPGDPIRVVDALLTNFHAPRSTLLALVGAVVGAGRWRQAYQIALDNGFRFLSYGDAMWIPQLTASAKRGRT